VIYGCFIFRNGMMIPNDCCIYVCLMVVPPTSIRVQVCGWFPDTRASFDYTLVLRWLSYYVQSLNMIVTSRSFHKFIYMRMKYIQLYIYIIYIYIFIYVCIYIYIYPSEISTCCPLLPIIHNKGLCASLPPLAPGKKHPYTIRQSNMVC